MLRNHQLLARLESSFKDFPRRQYPQDFGSQDTELRHAAVVLAIVDEGLGADVVGLPSHESPSENAALLLTRRPANLRRHAGQWALPGGRSEPGEGSIETALREMEEEVGLKPEEVRVLGVLDDYVTRSGYIMTPVVAWTDGAPALKPDPVEVASIHRIPLTELVRSDAPMLEVGIHEDRPVLHIPIGDDRIAAPTAAIIFQFAEVCLQGRVTRVAHFDQPEFAWR